MLRRRRAERDSVGSLTYNLFNAAPDHTLYSARDAMATRVYALRHCQRYGRAATSDRNNCRLCPIMPRRLGCMTRRRQSALYLLLSFFASLLFLISSSRCLSSLKRPEAAVHSLATDIWCSSVRSSWNKTASQGSLERPLCSHLPSLHHVHTLCILSISVAGQ